MSRRERLRQLSGSGSIPTPGRRRPPGRSAPGWRRPASIALDIEPVILGRDVDPGDAVVDTAAELGVRHVLVASGPAARAAVVERFGELCRRAEPAGVVVVLEFLPIFTIATLGDAVGVVAGGRLTRAPASSSTRSTWPARAGGRTTWSRCRRSCSPTCSWPTLRTGSTTRLRPACATRRCTDGCCPGRGSSRSARRWRRSRTCRCRSSCGPRRSMQAFPDPTDRARAVLAATRRLLEG